MGEIQKISCKKCDHSWQCNTGCGMFHARLETVAREFPEKIQQQIEADAQSHPLALFDFGFQAVSCPDCRKIVSVPVLSFLNTDRVYTGVCPDCKGAVGSGQPLVCPVCQSDELSTEQIGLWD